MSHWKHYISQHKWLKMDPEKPLTFSHLKSSELNLQLPEMHHSQPLWAKFIMICHGSWLCFWISLKYDESHLQEQITRWLLVQDMQIMLWKALGRKCYWIELFHSTRKEVGVVGNSALWRVGGSFQTVLSSVTIYLSLNLWKAANISLVLSFTWREMLIVWNSGQRKRK